ncbi:Arc family DNA-binding protein [Sinorhizobium meliloti]|uniref:Arc family DNA-binding protein n=1 Tax=Rhizobium meliloti TaxID=382 RepID=UPI000FD88068|nr:Arc family DNA-binding protein [Sinorhizobium meliloti]RVG88718.1 Arc family DNA-binding protein [Sinorhizobium meliloti]RVI39000.1 Arc family DNA-binding protein [Sinorhizobium meliloti]RVI46636.1 Arc family DNA-binding protein [Sinorhizobium meliloti]RVJ25637.1 Arc family DNA-binding protein [Sinorhizobium meliloti]RVK02284.1 Arc family DNA-binding protein [Sinorhizobium meliloti]
MTPRPKYPSDKQDQFMMRLPKGMRDRIKAEAEKNNRSMNSEIVSRLERSCGHERGRHSETKHKETGMSEAENFDNAMRLAANFWTESPYAKKAAERRSEMIEKCKSAKLVRKSTGTGAALIIDDCIVEINGGGDNWVDIIHAALTGGSE